MNKLLLYKFIPSFKLIKLKILKTYIKTNLLSSFICFFKFYANILILLIQNKSMIELK